MEKKTYILNIIKNIRESFSGSVVVYTMGNCYQFYEILKSIFPDAEPFYDGNHVYTKIDNEFYDIKGTHDLSNILLKIVDEEMIKRLTVNKWSDERRYEYIEEYRKTLLNK